MSVFTTTLNRGAIRNPTSDRADIQSRLLRTSGTLAQRPTLGTTDKGYLYFATNQGANGAPLWWNGTAWVDAASTIVA